MAVQNFYFFGSYNVFRPFIMEVDSGNDGVFIIPTTGGGYNYNVKTSDGQTFTGITGNLTITFPNPNTRYEVEISGLFPLIYFNNGSERLKIKDIKQWGDIEWMSMQRSFYGCRNLTWSATDVPNTTLVKNWDYAFYDTKINTNFNLLDKSNTISNAIMLSNCLDFDNDGKTFELDFQGVNNLYMIVIPYTKVEVVEFYNCQGKPCSAVWSASGTFRGCYDLISVKLFGYDNSIDLRPGWAFHNTFLGSQLDDLFTSFGTANSGATITISTAQSTSGIDTTIATAKGWTIVIV